MQGQSSVNFFDIYNKKRNQGATGTPSGSSAVSGITNNTPSYTSKYTKQMEDLDKDLMAEGLKIEKLSNDKKRDYVNSLSESEYQRLNQYRDAGYSFGASKALLDLERQRTSGVGGARSQAYQMFEPIGGQESTLNKANYIGYLTEKLDNRVQEEVVPRLTVSEREKRASKLRDKYKNMTDADWDKLYEEFVNDPKAKTYDDDSKDYTLKKYWIEKNTDRLDDLFSVGDQLKVTENADGTAEVTPDLTPGGFEILANVPASALATSSAVLRGVTNPVDNLWMITQLLATKEGRGLLADRYLSREGAAEAFEKDPIGRATDLFDLSSLLTKGASSTLRGAATAQRLAGYKDAAGKTQNAANRLGQLSQDANTVADLGISDAYDRILNKALARLSQGGRVSNAIGDYVSLTQQPLRTIWKGAGGINPKTGQPYNQTTGRWTFNGLQPALNKVWDSAKEKIQNQATGLTPEVRERIRQNPFIKEYRDRIEAMLNEQGAPLDNQRILEMPIEEVGQELLRRLEEYEAALEENGSEYQALRQTTRPYNFSDFITGVYEVFAKNGITVTPEGELMFSTTANPADMNPVNIARNVIKSMEPNLGNMTIAQLLDFRKQLRSLINYESDSRATRFSKGIIRQIVDGKLNKLAHKEIPSLAKVDEIYSKQINELKEFKDGLIYQQGEKRGQIKDNFYSIISTINTQNRQRMKARLEKIFPDLGARVEAIRMLPILAKTYQNSPQMMRALFQRAGFLGGISQSGGAAKAIMGWLLGIIADELFAKPMGEQWRKKTIDSLLSEITPEALQKLAEIKSKIDAGVALSEQEKADLATAMQEIAQKEYEYLDEKHQKEFDKIMESANNQQPKLPSPGMDTIGPDGTIKLGMGNQLNSPEEIKPKTRDERIQEIQAEGDVTPEEAEEITNGIEDFLDEIGADIEGNITPGEVNYDRFSTRVLEELMEDKTIPRTEKDKIADILARRSVQPDSWEELDQKYAYKINKLMEEEQRIGKVGKNKVKDKEYAAKQMKEWEKKKERLIEQMSEDYGIDQFEAADKYTELEQKGPDYIKQYKKSKRYAQDQAELEAVDQLRQKWSKQPEFTLKLDQDTLNKRKEIISNELKNGYEWEETGVGDRFTNGKDKGAIKYNEDGTIDVVFTENGYRDSGVMDVLPNEAWIRFEREPDRIQVKDLRGESEYQTVGRANPDERDITAEEGMETENYKGNKTVRELADDYGLEVAIVDKIFTEAGEEALGRAKGNLIELVKEIKEGTAPHEVFHPIFNMVNGKRRAEIIDLVRKNKGMTEKEAKEWLADNFSEYFRTGKFDTKPIPKGFLNKVKWFFNKVKEFLNGTWKNRKKIQKLFDDIMDGKISVEKPNGGRWEYQIQQKSLFDGREPSDEEIGTFIVDEYPKIHNRILQLAQRNGYTTEGFARRLDAAYDPDIETWRQRLKEEEIDLTPKELVMITDTINTIIGDLKNQKIVDKIKQGAIMAFGRLFKKMKENPLNVPEDLKGLARIDKQQEFTDLERFMDGLSNSDRWIDTGLITSTYDPDIMERMDKVKKQSPASDIKLKDLYKLQNMIEKHIEQRGYDVNKDVIEYPGLKDLMNRIKKMKVIQSKTSSFDKQVIEDSFNETEHLLENRMNDIKMAQNRVKDKSSQYPHKKFDPDQMADELSDVQEEMAYELGATYDPDVDKRHVNLKKAMRKVFDKYETFKKNRILEHIIAKHALNTLGAKVNELSQYTWEQINEVTEGTITDLFYQGVEEAEKRLASQKAKKAKKVTRDLVALSSMEVENFIKQIKNFDGKSPMPSIAITDPNVPHEGFGELTLVFGRDTVDPKVNPDNVIYGSDAWTPTFPDIKYKGGYSENFQQNEVQPLVQNLVDRGADLTHSDVERLSDYIRREMNRLKDKSDFNGRVYQYAEQIVMDATDEAKLDWDENRDAFYDLIDQVSDLIENRGPKEAYIPARYFNKSGTLDDVIEKIYNEGVTDFEYYEKENLGENLKSLLKTIIERTQGEGPESVIEELHGLTNFDADNPKVQSLVRDFVYDAKDRPLTPENVLEAMKNQRPVNRDTAPGSFRDMIGAEGTVINDIEEVRAKNFAKTFHNTWLGDISNLEEKYNTLAQVMREYIADPDMIETVPDNVIKVAIKEGYDPDVAQFKKNLEEEGQFVDVPNDVLKRIIDVVEQGKKIPNRFSESKPRRIVDLYKEVQYVLVPNADLKGTEELVKGTPLEGKVVGYQPDTHSSPRGRKMQELQKKYGNVFFSMGGVIMPIAMLLLMIKQEDEGQA